MSASAESTDRVERVANGLDFPTSLAFDVEGTPWIALSDGLPGVGNYHTNMAVTGPDGWLYFSQGALTNSGVVGLDALNLGWLRRLPHDHDLPGLDVVLAGVNMETADPTSNNGHRARTGAFSHFGVSTPPGHRLTARVPATASRWPGQVLVALFGDERPMTAPAGPRVGRGLARIDPADGSLPARSRALETPDRREGASL